MHKKVSKATVLTVLLFFLSVEFSEIVNFIYVIPYSLPFFLFLSSSETELHPVKLNYFAPFLFGLISDFLVFNNTFVLCLAFPLLSYLIGYLVIKLKISKQPIYFVVSTLYATFIYILGFPVWVGLFVLGSGFLSWQLFSLICGSFLIGKENGKA